MEIAVLGLGCFWGPEIKFSKLDGVIKTEVGYCGGNTHKLITKKFARVKQIMLK
jgi:peptide methionine sulfoxide reductase MsrA